ncbi:hypothetical protein [Streptomyces huasconensis]|uniref:hypothetical protein n=1 Tax=Streptomyces huasconensis TaxID=1854574 RepID=UPI0037016B39
MTGPEHYRAAEELLALAANLDKGDAPQSATDCRTDAQVHATLALAAATALSAPLDGETDSGMPQRDAETWWAVAGVKPQKRVDA